jgi:hypothetical protein
MNWQMNSAINRYATEKHIVAVWLCCVLSCVAMCCCVLTVNRTCTGSEQTVLVALVDVDSEWAVNGPCTDNEQTVNRHSEHSNTPTQHSNKTQQQNTAILEWTVNREDLSESLWREQIQFLCVQSWRGVYVVNTQ